jgi:predicted transcriptional regulator
MRIRSHYASGTLPTAGLGKREREIVELVYRLGRASASDVRERLRERPSYSSVRKMLTLVEEKGYVKHTVEGTRYIYEPAVRPDLARRSALRHVLDTFFGGSEEQLVTTLVREPALSGKHFDRLIRLIEEARGKKSAHKRNDD